VISAPVRPTVNLHRFAHLCDGGGDYGVLQARPLDMRRGSPIVALVTQAVIALGLIVLVGHRMAKTPRIPSFTLWLKAEWKAVADS